MTSCSSRSQSMQSIGQQDQRDIQEGGGSPITSRVHTPVIVLSPTISSTNSTLYVVQSPTPLSPRALEEQLVKFKLAGNCYNRPATPYSNHVNSNGDIRLYTNEPTPFDPDNL
ncbi:hypothetical protein ARMGADRAFT_1091691 [Armillaria gallica]|uniref:Uncharacterized protein n=1 Tax=Armillaria gallica TaxID=47427 RepID=A0A2H3CY79_ARMGA|nr:hypothetical protein ARMGADRAFT_1091691 [Armillaria gallica]